MKNKTLDAEIGKRLSSIRKRSLISVEEAIKKTGISKDAIYAYESGRRQLTAPALLKFANLYEVSIDEIMGTKVTLNRPKSVSFTLYKQDEKNRLVLSSESDEVVFFETNEWTLEYYVKSNELKLDVKLLAEIDKKVSPIIIKFDEKKKMYSLYFLTNKEIKIMNKNELNNEVIIIGEYAGRIEKQKRIDEFF